MFYKRFDLVVKIFGQTATFCCINLARGMSDYNVETTFPMKRCINIVFLSENAVRTITLSRCCWNVVSFVGSQH